MMIDWFFPEWVLRWLRGFFRFRLPSSGIVWNNWDEKLLHSHFGKHWRWKLFHPKSSVSRHARSTNLELQTDNNNEPDSDLQRLWARDTKDLGVLEVFYFYFHLNFEIAICLTIILGYNVPHLFLTWNKTWFSCRRLAIKNNTCGIKINMPFENMI